MANFDLYFPKLLKLEGGFVDHPNDRGGPTNKGITIATWRRYAPALGVEPTVETLKAMSDSQARVIYKPGYWDVVRGDDLDCQELAEMLCDFAVTSGPGQAIRELQRAVNKYWAVKISVDGIMGPVTTAWCVGHPRDRMNGLYQAFRDQRLAFYRKLAQKPGQSVFLKGWENRVNSFPEEIAGGYKRKGTLDAAVQESLARGIAAQLWITSSASNPDLEVGHALDAARKFVDQCIKEGLL